jgi:hypothetical protein
MVWLRMHLVAVALVTIAVVGAAGVFTFAKPAYHPYVTPSPPERALPYTNVVYTASDAKRAFAAVGIRLVIRTHEPVPVKAPPIVDLSTADDVVEVDAFGDPTKVAASGFSDYFTFSNGRWVRTPPRCSAGAANAERWHGNVRVVLSCGGAGPSAPDYLRRIAGALARL